MQLPQIISETDQLSYTVRILEGIGRVIALGEALLRYLFNFDIARLRDLVADGYLRAHRNIVEQPFACFTESRIHPAEAAVPSLLYSEVSSVYGLL